MTPQTLRVLSLGAGVQSTTLALLAAEGALPRLDAAVFADTGWEPAAVYEHLVRLSTVLIDANIPVYVVRNGSLRQELVSPTSRFAAIPYYTQNTPGPCQPCEATGQVPHNHDDTCGTCTAVFKLGTDRCTRCRGTGWDDGRGIGRRQCTREYKITPIRQQTRALLGAKPGRRVPAGHTAESWIGFSADEEATRVNRRRDSGAPYLLPRYPLIELGMDRSACSRWLRSRGWNSVAKSACIGCPFHGNAQWRQLRDNHPNEWADAVEVDHAIRHGGARGKPLTGTAYLHRSRLPLDQAPIDHVTRAEWADRQGDLLDLIAEHGEPDGCSPYGCRSGAPATHDPGTQR